MKIDLKNLWIRKKKLILGITAGVTAAAIGCGIWYQAGHSSSEPVYVFPFQYIGMTEYWGDSQESHGPVTTDKIQTVFLSDTQTVTEILVQAGDAVKKGDLLMTFDTTLSDLQLERKRLDVEKLKLQLEDAKDELRRLNGLKPMEPPEYDAGGEEIGEDDGSDKKITGPKAFPGMTSADSQNSRNYDGSTAERALILWIPENTPVDYSKNLLMMESLAAQLQEQNQTQGSIETIIPDEVPEESTPEDEPEESIPEDEPEESIPEDEPEESIPADDVPDNGDNTGGNNPGGDNTGGDNAGGDNTGGDNPGGDNTGGDNAGGDNTGGDNPGGDNAGGDNTGGDNSGGDNTGSDNAGGDNTGGDNPGGDNTGSDNAGGDNTGGDNPGGDNTGSDNAGGDNSGDDNTGGDPPSGDNIGENNTGGNDPEGANDTDTGNTTDTSSDSEITAVQKIDSELIPSSASAVSGGEDYKLDIGEVFYVVFKISENDSADGAAKFFQCFKVQKTGKQRYDLYIADTMISDYSAEEIKKDDDFSEIFGDLFEEEEEVMEPLGSYTAAQLAQMRSDQQKKIKDLELQIKMTDAEYKIMQKEISDGNIYADSDGKVVSLLTEEEAKQTKQPILKVSGGGGFYVEGFISELEKENMKIGQDVTINDWNTGMTYTGTVDSMGDFPTRDGYYNGNGNPNASYYPFTVFVDETADLQAGSYVSIQYSNAESQNGIYLENPFLRTEKGKSYVLILGEGGKLEQRWVTTGKSLWGNYTEILDGLTEEDLIAFPYGKNVKPGVAAQEGDLSNLYS